MVSFLRLCFYVRSINPCISRYYSYKSRWLMAVVLLDVFKEQEDIARESCRQRLRYSPLHLQKLRYCKMELAR